MQKEKASLELSEVFRKWIIRGVPTVGRKNHWCLVVLLTLKHSKPYTMETDRSKFLGISSSTCFSLSLFSLNKILFPQWRLWWWSSFARMMLLLLRFLLPLLVMMMKMMITTMSHGDNSTRTRKLPKSNEQLQFFCKYDDKYSQPYKFSLVAFWTKRWNLLPYEGLWLQHFTWFT